MWNTTQWGSSGPTIDITIEKSTETAEYVVYSWNLHYSQNYSPYPVGSYAAPWSLNINGEYYSGGTVSLNGGSTYLSSGTETIYKSNYDQELTLEATINWGGLNWNKITKSSESLQASVTCPAAKIADTPTIRSSKKIVLPTDTINISWSGSTNNAKALVLTIKDSSYNVLINKKELPVTTSSFSINLQDYQVKRGDTIYASMYTTGKPGFIDGYDTGSIKVGKVNNLPQKPRVTKSKEEIRGFESVLFTIDPIKDPDNQDIIISYSLNQRKNAEGQIQWEEVADNKVTVSLNSIGIIEGVNTIYFKAFDGLEESGISSYNFTAISKPEFDSGMPTLKYTAIATETSAILVKDGTLTFSLKADLTNPKVDVILVSSSQNIIDPDSLEQRIIGEGYYTYSGWNRVKELFISFVELPDFILPYGNFFKIKIKVYGPGGETDCIESKWLQEGRRPFKPKLPSKESIQITNDAIGKFSKANYFKSEVTINLVNPSLEEGHAPIAELNVIARQENGQEKITSCNKDLFGPQSITISDLIDVPANERIFLDISILDTAGQSQKMTLDTNIFKTSPLAFLGKEVSVNPTLLRPLFTKLSISSDQFDIKFPPTKSTGCTETSYVYKIGLPLDRPGKHEYVLQQSDYTFSAEQDILNTVTIQGDIIRYILNHELTIDDMERNELYEQAYIEIQSYDSFNQVASLKESFSVNFSESPVWPNKEIQLYHDYQIRESENYQKEGPIDIYTPTNGKTDLNRRMFNSREGIVLAIPIAQDANNDIVDYKIYLGKGEFTNILDVSIDNVIFDKNPWVSIPASKIQEQAESGYFYYRHKASEYITNSFFYFKVIVTDSKGNVSEDKISNTFIIGCRTRPPQFTTGNTKINRANTTITIDYKISIKDLGGSAIRDQWDLNFYNKYKNFEREIFSNQLQTQKIYKPKIGLKISIDSDPKFNTDNLQTKYFVQEYDTGSPESQMINFTHSQTIFENFDETISKFYIRFQIVASYGLDKLNLDGDFAGLSYVESQPQIASYFGNVPTVSHRSHTIGINTSNFVTDDIAVIESYPGKRYIKLKGINTVTGENFEIKVDLFTGEVSGSKISGGSW